MYDVIIIGAGPGGYVAATKAGSLGLKTLVIEKNRLGGVCLHEGCIPTKALLASAGRLLAVRDAKTHGISVSEPVFDWAAMQKRKDKVVDRLTKGIASLFKMHQVEWKEGEAEVIDANTVRLGEEEIQTRHIILATGAHPVRPDIPGLSALFDKGSAKLPTELLSIEAIPNKLLIIGDNVFSVEYASLFAALGSQVTLLSPAARLLPYMDGELSDFIGKELRQQGVDLVFSATPDSFEENRVFYHAKEEKAEKTFDVVLLAMGSAPNQAGLQSLQLKTDEQGFVQTDAFMRTSVNHVYAIGDLIGKAPLAHVASAEGVAAVLHIKGVERPMRYHKIPMAVYSHPELASVGLTEEEARAQYETVQVHKYPLSANGKALAEGDAKGFVKILSVAPYDEVVGMHIAGSKATDLIAEGVLALQLEATVHDLAATMHAHPTPAEIIMEAAQLAAKDAETNARKV